MYFYIIIEQSNLSITLTLVGINRGIETIIHLLQELLETAAIEAYENSY